MGGIVNWNYESGNGKGAVVGDRLPSLTKYGGIFLREHNKLGVVPLSSYLTLIYYCYRYCRVF